MDLAKFYEVRGIYKTYKRLSDPKFDKELLDSIGDQNA